MAAVGERVGEERAESGRLPSASEDQGRHARVIDDNHSERQIKQMVIGRKNWLFAGSEGGAENAAILLGVVISCKLAGIDPFAYLRDVLMRISSHPADRVTELIPREWGKRFGLTTAHRARPAA